MEKVKLQVPMCHNQITDHSGDWSGSPQSAPSQPIWQKRGPILKLFEVSNSLLKLDFYS